jgi:UPF0716 protein FxsA
MKLVLASGITDESRTGRMIFGWLLLLFVVTPLVELAILLKVNEWLGSWRETILLVILTGFVGAWLAKAQGLIVLQQIQQDMNAGRLPAPRLLDGLMIIVAGALLVTPGLITDAVGFLLLIPSVRVFLKLWLRARIEKRIERGNGRITFWRI